MSIVVNQEATCVCEKVRIRIKGPLFFSTYCHCMACTRMNNCSPVSLLGVGIPPEKVEFMKGSSSDITVRKGYSKMIQAACKHCGTGLYQQPAGASFVATYPATFHGGNADRKPNPLPKELWPQKHINYESRKSDCTDSLPKYFGFTKTLVNNDGSIVPPQ